MPSIRIEISPMGLVQTSLVQPADERLWRLYTALRPQIAALERAARWRGPNFDGADEAEIPAVHDGKR